MMKHEMEWDSQFGNKNHVDQNWSKNVWFNTIPLSLVGLNIVSHFWAHRAEWSGQFLWQKKQLLAIQSVKRHPENMATLIFQKYLLRSELPQLIGITAPSLGQLIQNEVHPFVRAEVGWFRWKPLLVTSLGHENCRSIWNRSQLIIWILWLILSFPIKTCVFFLAGLGRIGQDKCWHHEWPGNGDDVDGRRLLTSS